MNWLGWIWSKIWVEQRQSSQSSQAELTRKNTETALPAIYPEDFNPYFIERENFKFSLSHEWRQKPAKEEDQSFFHHDRLDIDLVFSSLSVKIPDFKLKKIAEGWLGIKARAVDSFKRTQGIYPVGVQDDVFEQSWGYQVSIIRTYIDSEFYRCFGFVGANMILSLTFEGRMTDDRKFDEEIEKVIASMSFSDSVWGERKFPEGSRVQ